MDKNVQTLAWAKDTILPVMNQILHEWSEFIIVTVMGGTFYAPVSAEEKMSIVQAVVQASYGVGGRFYQVSAVSAPSMNGAEFVSALTVILSRSVT